MQKIGFYRFIGSLNLKNKDFELKKVDLATLPKNIKCQIAKKEHI
jgi:hypothetical protein